MAVLRTVGPQQGLEAHNYFYLFIEYRMFRFHAHKIIIFVAPKQEYYNFMGVPEVPLSQLLLAFIFQLNN